MSADGNTVVFTTHSVEDIERSHRVVVLAPGGRLVAVGSPTEVLQRAGAATFPDLYAMLVGSPATPAPEQRSTLADTLNSPASDIRADLRVVADVLQNFRSNFPHDGNPVGNNAETPNAKNQTQKFKPKKQTQN